MAKGLSIELRPGEQIKVGDNIVVTIEEKNGRSTRLRVDAPSEIRIKKVDTSSIAQRVMSEGVLK